MELYGDPKAIRGPNLVVASSEQRLFERLWEPSKYEIQTPETRTLAFASARIVAY